MSVLIVGASAAGLSTLEALRRKGYHDRITVLGAEWHLPYDRPPLSKQYLVGTWDEDRTKLRPDEMLSKLDAEFVLGESAVGLEVERRTVHTASGRELQADSIVVATGLRARTLPGQGELEGVHVLRTLDDAAALRKDLLEASRLVVVGDGVLGAEIAATARKMGLTVTLAGPQSAPLESQLGPTIGGLLKELHAAEGVQMKLGTAVTGLTEVDGRVAGVRLDSGDVLPADVVVVALGAAPATEWLADSGLTIDNGLVCDSRCQAGRRIRVRRPLAARDLVAPFQEGIPMKVIIDQDKCVASGQCVTAAIDVFDQRDEDGIVVLLNDNPPEDLAADVHQAAAVCPALAIVIED